MTGIPGRLPRQAWWHDRTFFALAALVSIAGPLAPQSFQECTRLLHTFEGEAAGDQFGWVSAPLADVDGDGVQEVIVSAATASVSKGRVYVYSGRTGVELFHADGANSETLGFSVRDAGDVDGDGLHDVIAGAPGLSVGKVYVYSGADGSTLLAHQMGANGTGFGSAVTGIGDVDGDGFGDIAVGGPGGGGAGAPGRVWILSGADASLLWSITGEAAGDNLGSSVAIASDVTGDGRDDLVVGAPNAGAGNRGKVYVYNVVNQALWWDAEADVTGVNLGTYFVAEVGDVNADGTPDIYGGDFNDSTLGGSTGRMYVFDGTNGDVLHSIPGDAAGDGFGIGRGAGDVDGDGHADLLICGWTDSEGAPSAGKASVISGADGSVLREITSTTPGDTFGFDAHGMGDVDGDGRLDYFVTGANNDDVGPNAGKCYLIAGGEPVFDFGAGLAGTGGLTPELEVTTCMELDVASTLNVSNGLVSTAGWIAYGADELALPALGGTLYVLPLALVAHVLDGSGAAGLAFQTPANPALVGSALFLQGIYVDPGAPFGASLTAGLRLIFG